jgi:hypothetical protein
MTALTLAEGQDEPLRSGYVDDQVRVLASPRLRPGAGPGPCFAEDVWDLRAAHHTPNTRNSDLRAQFGLITDPVWRADR